MRFNVNFSNAKRNPIYIVRDSFDSLLRVLIDTVVRIRLHAPDIFVHLAAVSESTARAAAFDDLLGNVAPSVGLRGGNAVLLSSC